MSRRDGAIVAWHLARSLDFLPTKARASRILQLLNSYSAPNHPSRNWANAFAEAAQIPRSVINAVT
jgi:hypothetical protein